MILVVGLGNPGRAYERSRHNLGFQVVDRMAALTGAPPWRSNARCEAQVARSSQGERAFLLAKPQTYMNHSGRAVAGLLHYYKVARDDLLVVVDDMDLALGKLRQRVSGSDGGHKGLRSIIEALGTREFKRLRVGIGRPPGRGSVVSYVLGAGKAEQEALQGAVDEAARAALAFVETGHYENWSSG